MCKENKIITPFPLSIHCAVGDRTAHYSSLRRSVRPPHLSLFLCVYHMLTRIYAHVFIIFVVITDAVIFLSSHVISI